MGVDCWFRAIKLVPVQKIAFGRSRTNGTWLRCSCIRTHSAARHFRSPDLASKSNSWTGTKLKLVLQCHCEREKIARQRNFSYVWQSPGITISQRLPRPRTIASQFPQARNDRVRTITSQFPQTRNDRLANANFMAVRPGQKIINNTSVLVLYFLN